MKKIMMVLCVAVAVAQRLESWAAELPNGYEAVDSVTANGAQPCGSRVPAKGEPVRVGVNVGPGRVL